MAQGGMAYRCPALTLTRENEHMTGNASLLADKTTPIDKFAKVTYSYGLRGGDPHHSWPGLYFTEAGAARLMNTAGFIIGLYRAGQTELAKTLAKSLDDKLSYLASYGGDREYEVDDGKQTVKFRDWRVILGDDGTLGGFTVRWHRAVSLNVIQQQAEEYQPRLEQHYDTSEWTDDQKWQQALADVRKSNGIPEKGSELEKMCVEHKRYVPEWLAKARERGESGLWDNFFWVEYAYSFNGGLLLHGMGHETFAVDISNDGGPHWSVHT